MMTACLPQASGVERVRGAQQLPKPSHWPPLKVLVEHVVEVPAQELWLMPQAGVVIVLHDWSFAWHWLTGQSALHKTHHSLTPSRECCSSDRDNGVPVPSP